MVIDLHLKWTSLDKDNEGVLVRVLLVKVNASFFAIQVTGMATRSQKTVKKNLVDTALLEKNTERSCHENMEDDTADRITETALSPKEQLASGKSDQLARMSLKKPSGEDQLLTKAQGKRRRDKVLELKSKHQVSN